MGGVSAAVSTPVERVKLLIQNQDEMIRANRLSEPYKGIGDCFKRTIQEEGIMSLWKGNTANVIRYFLTQVLNFAFKDYFKKLSTLRKTTMAIGSGLLMLKSGGIAGLYCGFNISCVGIIMYYGLYFGMYDSLKPMVLVEKLQVITNGAGLASYLIDTVCKGMMMTSGEAVKYKAFSQILKNEGAKSLFNGAGANILRAVAGAGVCAGYDKLQMIKG
ncbi:hypothetical protein REPUB_Repub10bG0060900 [Reevesia pubescens]